MASGRGHDRRAIISIYLSICCAERVHPLPW